MVYGISKFVKKISISYLYRYFKRQQVHRKNKSKYLKVGLGCSLHNVIFGKYNYIGKNVTLINVTISDYSYVNSNSVIRDCKIGKFCSIASDVKIVLGWHPINLISTHPTFYSNNKAFRTFSKKNYFSEYKPVTIGNDVWIGQEVMIPGGVKIGDGAVIAARSLVTKDIPPYTIVGGVPAKVIKKRFSEDEIKLLLEFKWWNKSDAWLKENSDKFINTKLFFRFINQLKHK